VRRTELQRALRAAADERAIPVIRGAVGSITQNRHGVLAGDRSVRYLVAADGLHSGVRKSMNLDAGTEPGIRRWGQRRHFELAPWSGYIEVHWGVDAEAYVTPVGDGLVGVAILSSSRTPFDEQLQEFPELIERMGDAPRSPVMGAGPLRQSASRRVAGRVLLVGDAAGYVDALTGEGIAVGLDSARRLACCLAADRPEKFESEWRRSSRRYRLITGSLLRVSAVPALRGALVPFAHRAPALFDGVVRQLSR
jgi:flavin-dependent dehydrogenase